MLKMMLNLTSFMLVQVHADKVGLSCGLVLNIHIKLLVGKFQNFHEYNWLGDYSYFVPIGQFVILLEYDWSFEA